MPGLCLGSAVPSLVRNILVPNCPKLQASPCHGHARGKPGTPSPQQQDEFFAGEVKVTVVFSVTGSSQLHVCWSPILPELQDTITAQLSVTLALALTFPTGSHGGGC